MSPSDYLLDRSTTITDILQLKHDRDRHNIPISREEIESMVVYVRETRGYTAISHPEWDFSITSPEFNFIRRTDNTSDLVRTRSWIKVPNVPPQVLFHLLTDPHERKAFDKYYLRFEVSRKVSTNLDVLISEVDAPIGMSNREFVEWRRTSIPVSPDVGRKDSVYAIELRSCDDDQCSPSIRPRSRGIERAETWLSGYVITWWLDPISMEPLGSEILVMSQIDMRGMIPQMFVNIVGGVSAPTKWCRSLVEASTKFCKKSNIGVSMTDAEIEKKLGIERIGVNNSS